MFLRINPNNGVPLGVQICAGLRLAVATERLRAGDRLPSARDLASELRVNFHTVRKAFADLEAEGVLETRRGLGTFVAAAQRAGRTELRRVVREHIEALLGELAGGDVTAEEVKELWLEEWQRRAAARRKP